MLLLFGDCYWFGRAPRARTRKAHHALIYDLTIWLAHMRLFWDLQQLAGCVILRAALEAVMTAMDVSLGTYDGGGIAYLLENVGS